MNKWMQALPKIPERADFQDGFLDGFLEGFGLAILGPHELMNEFRRVNPGLAALIEGFVDIMVDSIGNKLTSDEVTRLKHAAIIGHIGTLRWLARAIEV